MQGHYVPRFYLKGFTDPDVPEGHEPFLWVSEDGVSWRRKAPKNVGAEANYYVTPEAERTFQELETRLAPVLRTTCRREPLTDEETMWLGTLVAMMRFRVPAIHEHWQRILSERQTKRVRLLTGVFRNDPLRFQAFKRGHGIPENLPLDALAPKHFTSEVTRSESIAAALDGMLPFLDVLMPMRWHILASQAPHYFITSDHPVYVFDPTAAATGLSAAPLSQTSEITMPLSRELAFLATWPPGDVSLVPVEPDVVANINERSKRGASRFLVAPKPGCPGC